MVTTIHSTGSELLKKTTTPVSTLPTGLPTAPFVRRRLERLGGAEDRAGGAAETSRV